MTAEDGNAQEAETFGRSGLGIHGGRDQTMLWSTEGCVRVFDRHMQQIIAIFERAIAKAPKESGVELIPVFVKES